MRELVIARTRERRKGERWGREVERESRVGGKVKSSGEEEEEEEGEEA